MINREFEKEATIALYNCKYFPNNESEPEKIARDLADELDVTIVSSNFYQHSGRNNSYLYYRRIINSN